MSGLRVWIALRPVVVYGLGLSGCQFHTTLGEEADSAEPTQSGGC